MSSMSLKPRIGFLLMLLMAATTAGCSRAPENAAAGPLAVSAGQGSPEHSPRGVVRAPAERKPEIPRFEYAYLPPESADLQSIYQQVLDVDLWRQLPEVQAIDGMFVLPRRLRFVTAQCDGPGALYRPDEAEVVLCYETLRILYERGQEHQRRDRRVQLVRLLLQPEAQILEDLVHFYAWRWAWLEARRTGSAEAAAAV